MSRAGFPRRIPARILAIATLTSLVGGSLAWAQDPASDPRSVTVLGSDAHARRCAAAVANQDLSDRSVADCNRALNYPRLTRPGEIQLRVSLGILYLRRQEGEQALAQFDAVVAMDPRNAEAHLNRGAVLVQLQRFGPAIAEITEALGLGVDEPHKAYFNRGAAREALGDLRGAYEDYSTALEIEPDWGPANAELARFARARQEHLANVLNDSPTP